MATIDDKVVAMSFEASKFEQGVNKTISALDKLKAALHFPAAGKGLDDINAAAKRVDMGHIAKGVDGIKRALETLRLVGIGVLANLAAQAVRAGGRFIKAFTLDPLKAGFTEYTTNLNAVQTILANTQAAGTKLSDVNKALKELNDYSDKTIYNFSQMAKNIGTFTAAGVDLDTATGAIKGIANLAALSGSNADQASTAMYQLSQAISAGRVSLQDWNSVVNAGMGGTVFQRALAQTAVAMGKLPDSALKLVGPMKNVSIHGQSFRNSISATGKGKSWLTSDVLTKTLEQFTGDLSKAELKAQGFNDAQIKAIQTTASTAMHAATEVKTLQGVLDTAKETAGSGWAQTWQIIFGDFGEAKVLFTNVSNAINGFIKTSADARNKVLGDWKALGGRTVLIDAIKTAFHNLSMVVAPIKEAFRDIFPAATGKDLYALTLRFKEFTESLKPSPETVDNLKRTFKGLFALLDIGKQVISGIFSVFGRLFGVVGDGSGSFLQITAKIGDFIVKVDQALKKGDGLSKFFEGLGDILSIPLKILGALASAIANLFSGFSSGGVSGQIDGVTKALTPFQRVVQAVSEAWGNFLDSFAHTGTVLQPAFQAIADLFKALGPMISNAVQNMNFEAILATIRTGLFAGLVLMLKNFFGKGSFLEQVSKGLGGGIIQNIAGSFKALEGSMVAMQNNIKAKTLKEIAIAVGLLVLSIVALSFVDPKKLNTALAGIAIAMGELLGAMAILDKISKSGGFIKMPFIAGSMILLAGAIDILAIAVIALSKLSWGDLLKGLGGVGALLIGLVAATGPLSANSAGMIRAGLGITAIAIGLRIMAEAVQAFGGMNMGALAKGLGSIAASLGIIVAAMSKMPTKSIISAGIGIIAIAGGLRLLAEAVQKFGGMDLRTLGQGLAAVGASLVIIGAAMRLMPKNMALTGAGLIIVAGALNLVANAIVKMGGMSIGEIAKGLGTLAVALGILAAALYLMSGTLAGAAALGIAAAGIALLVPALATLGGLSWGTIIKGLTALGAAFIVIGAAGYVIAGAVPGLLGFGAALLLIGAGVALVGVGIAAIGVGLSAIAVAAPTALGVLLQAVVQFQEGIIKNVKLFILGLLEIVKALAATAPQFVDALVKIINSLLDVVIEAAPKIAQAMDALLNAALQVLKNNQGKIIQAGFDLILALLQGIKNNINQIVTAVVDIITRFLNAIASNLGKIIQAGSSILTSLLKGIAQHIVDVVSTVGDIIARFLSAIASNLGKIATAGLSILTRLLQAIASHLGDVIKSGTDVIVAFINGIGNAGPRIINAAVEAITKFIRAISQGSVKLIDEGMKAIINFLNGVAAAINANSGEMRAAGMRVGIAIVDGMTGGLMSKAGELYGKIESVMNKAVGLLHKIPGVKSPSTVTTDIGENIILGLVVGLDKNAQLAYNSATAVSNGTIKAFNDTFQTASPSKVTRQIGEWVGQGFAQGLQGSGEDVRKAFADLNSKLTEEMATARETIASEQDKLEKLRKEKKPDPKEIKEIQDVIKQNQDLLARSTAGHIALTKTLKDEKVELIGLIGDYNAISEKLKTAKDNLLAATKTRDDAIKSFTDQYATLPDIVTEDAEGNAVDQLATYMKALDNQAKAVTAYQSTLDQLRKLGLDDATYQKLLSEGPEDQRFADQLLSGGRTAVAALNTLDTNLMNVSKTLATNAGKNLYQAGVDAAAGLVKGLTAKKNKLSEAMDELADEILRTLKKALKIKSPSEEFADIGRLSMEGLALGFTSSTRVLTNSIDDVGKDAISAMEQTMRNMSDVVANELDPSVVLTPVLDLTQIRAQQSELSALTSPVPITAATSYSQAATISSAQTAMQGEEVAVVPGATSVKFEQNNYSPESLSEIEIYRQTKNQLSQLKTMLAIT